MKSILELGLEFFIPKKSLAKYDDASTQDKPVEFIIYDLLTLNANIMDDNENNQSEFLAEGEKATRDIIQKAVSKNEKLEFLTFYFNAKSPKKSITNNFVSPDAADFLTLLHLSIAFKKINEIYPPGASMFIGTEVNFFHKFATQDLRVTSEMTHTLLRFKAIIETMLKNPTQIFLFDVYEEISFFKKDFLAAIEKEKFRYMSLPNALDQLKDTADYYLENVIEKSAFPSDEAARNFCLFHSLDAAGYSAAIRSLPNLDKGLFKNYRNKILVNPRFVKNSHSRNEQTEIFLPLLPGSVTFSFNMLSLKKRNNKWEQISFGDIKKHQHKEFFVRDLPYPFFFTERRFKGDLG